MYIYICLLNKYIMYLHIFVLIHVYLYMYVRMYHVKVPFGFVPERHSRFSRVLSMARWPTHRTMIWYLVTIRGALVLITHAFICMYVVHVKRAYTRECTYTKCIYTFGHLVDWVQTFVFTTSSPRALVARNRLIV